MSAPKLFFKKGDIVTINCPGSPADGLRATFVVQSDRTGLCTVTLNEGRKSYKKGEILVVAFYELK